MTSPNRFFQLALLAISFLALGLGAFFLIKTLALPATAPALSISAGNTANLEFSSSPAGNEEIVAEVGGAVKSPSIYRLPKSSRVADFLKKAGGLTEEADRGWIEKNISLAAKVDDGAKLYFPRLGEVGSLAPTESLAANSTPNQEQAGAKININKATASELETLGGIGAKRAEAIIASRPYAKVEDLWERKIIPANVFAAIKDKISVK